MNEKTRLLVLELLAKAHEGALGAVQSRLEGLSAPDRDAARRLMGEFRETMHQGFEGLLRPGEVLERLASLIHGHHSPKVVRVLKDYAETVQLLLTESRDALRSVERPKGH